MTLQLSEIAPSILSVKQSNISDCFEGVSDFLYPLADTHPRSRSRILLHSEASDFPQEMLIAFNSTSIVEVSNHQFPESFTILDGSARYFFYKPDGSHLADVVLSPFGTNNSFYCYIPNLLHHRFCPLTKYALAHELAFSHFDPSLTTIFLDCPFDHISGLSNKNLSLVPVSLFSNSFDSLYLLAQVFIM